MYNVIVIIDKEAEKFIGKLDKPTRIRILNALLALAENPYTCPNVKKLAGNRNLIRMRVGDYRIIFRVENNKLIVLVLRIGSRGDVYRSTRT